MGPSKVGSRYAPVRLSLTVNQFCGDPRPVGPVTTPEIFAARRRMFIATRLGKPFVTVTVTESDTPKLALTPIGGIALI